MLLQADVLALNPHEFIDWLYANLTDKELDARTHGQNYGAGQNYPRVEAVARYCVEHWEGDLVEIGCLYGSATLLFAQIAHEYGRRVIAVDPWLELPFYGPDPYGVFCRTMGSYKDTTTDIVKMSSLTEEAITYVKNRPLCFAYIDGLHTYEAVSSDIRTIAHCAGIVSVDDLIESPGAPSYNEHIRRAFNEGAELLHRTPMPHYLCREGYLVPAAHGG